MVDLILGEKWELGKNLCTLSRNTFAQVRQSDKGKLCKRGFFLTSYGISVTFVRDCFSFCWTSRSAGQPSIRSRLTVDLLTTLGSSCGEGRFGLWGIDGIVEIELCRKCIHAPCLVSLWGVKAPANVPSHLVNSRLTTSLQLVTNSPWTRMCARNRPAMPAVRASTYVLPPSYFSTLPQTDPSYTTKKNLWLLCPQDSYRSLVY